MTTVTAPRDRRLRRFAAIVAAATATAIATAAPATAAPVTYTSGSATVEFSTGTFAASSSATQRVYVKGKNFNGNGTGGSVPVVAFKLDDMDTFAGWGSSTGDEFSLADWNEPDVVAFKVDPARDWGFEGWFDVPANVSKTGPGLDEHLGRHWFRILAGAFSTAGVGIGNTSAQIVSVKGYVDFLDPLTTGFLNGAGTYTAGATIPAAPATLTVKGVGFTPNATVSATFDAAPIAPYPSGGTAGTPLVADASGAFTATVPLSPGAPGAKALVFTTGAVSHSVTLTRVAQTAAHVTAQTVRPGGTVVVSGSGFVGITGKGQKVGLILQPGDRLLGCAQASDTGAFTVSGKIPADEATGDKSLFLAAGASCVTGGPVLDPMPRLTQLTFNPATPGGPAQTTGLTLSATAPVLTTTAKRVSAGGSLPIVAEGFLAGEQVDAKLGAAVAGGPLTADATGKITSTVAIPAGTAPGDAVVTLVSRATATPTGTVAVGVKVDAAPKVTITSSAPAAPGSTVTFTLSGFFRADSSAGQKVGVKIGTGAISSCVAAAADGTASGSLVIPADAADGALEIRFLTGTSCIQGGTQDDLPARSIAASVQVAAVPVATPTPVPPVITPAPTVAPTAVPTPTPTVDAPVSPKPTKVKTVSKGASVEFSLPTGSAGLKLKIGAKTKAKVKLTTKAKAKIVTVVSAKTVTVGKGKAPKAVLKLTADGRKLLRARGRLQIVVTITLPAGQPTTKTFTLGA